MTGQCLCGSVAFEIGDDATPIELCHCPKCRRAYGGAFAATFYVRASAFRWLRGGELVTVYDAPIQERPPPYRHAFCRTCGSPLPIIDREHDHAEIPAGTMNDDPGVRPIRHIFTARKAPWYELDRELPEHGEHVPLAAHLLMRLVTGKARG